MSVRKRTWTTSSGEKKEAWVADYIDQNGERHIQTFARKKEADEYHSTVRVDVRKGVHTAPNKSIDVAQAAEDWLAFCRSEKLERSTLAQYRQHVDKHIVPRIGRDKLAKLTRPHLEKNFRDNLLETVSRPLAKKVLTSLKSLLKDAMRRGNVSQNVALDVKITMAKRDKKKLEVGVDIPTPDEIKRLIAAAPEKMRALLLVTIFAGLRASELRGLRWQDLDLERGEIHVRQRADRYNEIGSPKSEAGNRVIPIGPKVVLALKQHKIRCGNHRYVFATSTGEIDHHANMLRKLVPVMSAAEMMIPVKDEKGKPTRDEEGKPVMEPKYSGLHNLRHFYASWCINRRADGGLELPPKVVQERLGHSSIVVTMDTYGHLFPRADDGAELAQAEALLA